MFHTGLVSDQSTKWIYLCLWQTLWHFVIKKNCESITHVAWKNRWPSPSLFCKSTAGNYHPRPEWQKLPICRCWLLSWPSSFAAKQLISVLWVSGLFPLFLNVSAQQNVYDAKWPWPDLLFLVTRLPGRMPLHHQSFLNHIVSVPPPWFFAQVKETNASSQTEQTQL